MAKILALSSNPDRQTPRQALRARTLSEAFPATFADAAAPGLVLRALTRESRPVLWVQDRLSARETGAPYMLRAQGGPEVLRVALSRPADVLQAMEDGLACTALSAVIGEIWGNPPALSFTASKRLVLRAERSALPCWLIRPGAEADLSAARNRWRVASLPSSPHPDDRQAPGAPRWRAELFRSRLARPGTWVVAHDGAADRLDFSPASGDGALGAGDGTDRRRAAR